MENNVLSSCGYRGRYPSSHIYQDHTIKLGIQKLYLPFELVFQIEVIEFNKIVCGVLHIELILVYFLRMEIKDFIQQPKMIIRIKKTKRLG